MIDAKLLRIITGEEIIAELISEDDNFVTVVNALVIIPTQNGSIGFTPWAPVIDKDDPEIKISRNHIVYLANLEEPVKKKYNEIYGSKLITPDEKKLIL